MAAATIFITGTDTGVGKTVLTVLLAWHLRAAGLRVAAFKPVCSGGRDDARRLRAALGSTLTLDEINPWHFRAPLAPVLAARREHRRIRLSKVVDQVRELRRRCDVLLVEGAGGLLSPLGEGFDSRDLIRSLRAIPVVVAANRLGAVNQIRLVLAALSKEGAARAHVVLSAIRRPDLAARTNAVLLAEFFDPARLHELPRVAGGDLEVGARRNAPVHRAMARLTRAIFRLNPGDAR